MTKLKRQYILPMAMMFGMFFMLSFVTGLQNPMGVIVRNQFGVSNFLSQLGNAANFIAYLCMGIPTGMILQRIGYKRTALIAILVGIAGLVTSYISGIVGSFAVYVAGAFISGFSMCMLNSTVNPMVNTMAGGGSKGNQFLQYGGTLNSLGATIVPILVGSFIGDATRSTISDATPALIIALCIFVAAFIVLALIKLPEPHIIKKDDNPSDEDGHRSPLSYRHFVFGIIAIFFYVGVEVSIPNIANLYMTSDVDMGGLHLGAGLAGSIVGTYWFLMLIGRFIGATLSTKISPRKMLAGVNIIAICLVLLAIFLPNPMVKVPIFNGGFHFAMQEIPLNIFMLILCGLCTSVMWGNIFNLAVENLGKHTAAASGIFMTMVCGGGILPMIQGLVADNVGYINSYFVTIVGLLIMLWYAVSGSKIKGQKQ